MKKRTDNFEKFLPGKKGSAIKEQFRQEKKKWKKDRAEAFELKKKREIEIAHQITPAPFTIKKKMDGAPLPLNKFIAHCGVSGRREAAMMVRKGEITVNGEIITEPGHKVTDQDDIQYNGKKLHLAKNLVYVLLNKPKDYLTTLSDPEGRKTVLDLVKKASAERIYPVGRLDRNTTGVLLLTNDGELTQKLSHPSNEVKKIYEVRLDKPLAKADMEAIADGITLEDGFIQADAIAYADSKDKSVIGIEIHSGRNRIVRRIFEHLRYDVRNLDRVMFAGLTKKNVDRSKWRFLSEKEVRALKFLNASYHKKSAHNEKMAAADAIELQDRQMKNPLIDLDDDLSYTEMNEFKPSSKADKDPTGDKPAKKFRKTKPRVSKEYSKSFDSMDYPKARPRVDKEPSKSFGAKDSFKPKPRGDKDFTRSYEEKDSFKPKPRGGKDYTRSYEEKDSFKPKPRGDKDYSRSYEEKSAFKAKPRTDKDASTSYESKSAFKAKPKADKDASTSYESKSSFRAKPSADKDYSRSYESKDAGKSNFRGDSSYSRGGSSDKKRGFSTAPLKRDRNTSTTKRRKD
jgi:23S rRNA pseudouridine2605 synthase